MEIKEVHSDERRSINLIENLLPDNKEFTIIKLNAGKAIGGCLHSVSEHFCIIKGEGEFWHGKNKVKYIDGEHAIIQAEQPHAFVAETNSIIIEWGVKSDDKGKHDYKMREEVNLINEKSND